MSDKDILKSLDLNNIQNSSLIANANQSGTILAIPLDNIKALAQVRTEFNKGFSEQNIDTKEENTAEDENVNDSINALALSIKNRGLQNPIIVRPAHVDDDFNKPKIDDQYVIVSGERRYRATKLLREWQQKEIEDGTFNDSEKKIETIDCIVKDYKSELDVFSDQLTENIQRVDLDGFETSMAIQRFSELYLKEHPELSKVKRDIIANKFGKSLYWVSQMMSFADLKYPDDAELLDFFKKGTISHSPRCGYELIKVYLREPEATLKFLRSVDRNQEVFDRSYLPSLNTFIKEQSGDSETEKLTEESQLNQPGLTLSSTETSQPDEESQDEYFDKEEREKSDKPKMFAKEQENDAPTAGINASNSYTDKDTKVEHDLSDRIERAEERDYDPSEHEDYSESSNDTEEVYVDSINCEYTGENGITYNFKMKFNGDFDSNTEYKFIADDGNEITAPVSKIKLLSFNFR